MNENTIRNMLERLGSKPTQANIDYLNGLFDSFGAGRDFREEIQNSSVFDKLQRIETLASADTLPYREIQNSLRMIRRLAHSSIPKTVRNKAKRK